MNEPELFEKKIILNIGNDPYDDGFIVEDCPIKAGAGNRETSICAFSCERCKLAVNVEFNVSVPFVLCSGKTSKKLKRYITIEKKKMKIDEDREREIQKKIDLFEDVVILYITRRGFAIHADGCPIRSKEWNGIPYANVMDDCSGCEFLIDVRLNEKDDWILCGGFTKLPPTMN